MPRCLLLLLIALVALAPASHARSARAQADAPAAPQRVHLFVDRTTELSGTVVEQDDHRIVIERNGERREFRKDAILDIVPLLEISAPTAGIIYRRDGSAFRAELIADGFDAVEYRIGKVPGSIARAEVYRVALSRPFEEQYRALKASTHKDDTVRRLGLCDWLVAQRKYEEARSELQLLVADSKLPEAVSLLRQVEAQLAMSKPRERSTESDDLPPAIPDRNGRPLPTRVLTPEEVNLIKVYEIDFDRPPRVAVDPTKIKELLEAYSSSPLVPSDAPSRAALMQGDPLKVVQLAFALKAREFYTNIKVVTEPSALVAFRTLVHDGWLIPNCATSRCHGGPDAGRLFLFNTNTADPRVRYANLLNVLKGTVDGEPLISVERPEASLLIQCALPPEEATHPHPTVKGWRSVLGSKANADRLRASLGWIRSLYQPRPVYPFDYTPPDLSLPQPGSAADADEPTR